MDNIIELARQQGVIRPRDLAGLGASAPGFRRLVQNGILTKTGRGLYTLTDFEVTEFHSLAEAARAQSKAVICLLSALSFHGVGTQMPRQTWVAVPYGARIAASSVPMRVIVLRSPAYEAGIENHEIEGVDVPVYCIAKTVADCFKFRNKVGIDVAIEALREALAERRCSRDEIHHYARIDRMENTMRPYLEVLAS